MRNSEKQYPHTYSSPLIKGVRGLLRNIANLKPGDHLCCLYETEEEHRALLTPFLRQGLEQGEKVLYIVDARTAETVLDYLRDDGPALERSEGLDVEPYLASGQLDILTVDDAYMRNGVFDPDGMIALLRSATERALVEGYAALRVTGEMTWALRGLPGSERLIEYESRLNTFFPGSKSLAICQYDRRVFDPALLLDVLVTHPIAVVGTEIYDNFYYMPPEDFLSGNRSEATLRDWLKNLVERRRTEEEIRRLARFPGENPNPVLQITHDGTIIYANQASLPLLNVWGCKIGQSLPAGQRELIGDVICSGVSKTIEVEVEGREFSLTFAPIADAGYINVYGLDITERKRAEEALRQERDRAQKYLDIAGVMFVAINAKGEVTLINQKGSEVLGYEQEDIIGKNWFDSFLPVSVKEQVRTVFHRLIAGEICPLEYYENPVLTKGGEERIIAWHNTILKDDEGNIIGTLSSGEDITERNRAEETLAQERNLLRTLIDNMPDFIYVKDAESRFVVANIAVAHVMGGTPEELLGKTDFDFYPYELAAQYYADEQEMIRSRQPLLNREEPLIDAGGNRRWILSTKVPLYDSHGNAVGLVGIGRDITGRKRMVEALRESQSQFQDLYENAPNAYFSVGVDGHIRRCNRRAGEMLGYAVDELVGRPRLGLYADTPHGKEKALKVFQRFLAGETVTDEELQMQKADGTLIWVSLTMNSLRDAQGQVVESRSVVVDITERKRAEEMLRKSKEFIETIFNNIDDSISIIDTTNFRIVKVNRTFLNTVNMEEKDVIGKTCYEVTHHRCKSCEPPDDICPLAETLKTGECSLAEHIHYSKDGGEIYVEVSTSPIRNEKGEIYQVVHVARNITDRKRAEEQIKASLEEKEALLREVHHRVKNNMQVIYSLLNLQERKIKDERYSEMLKESQNRIKSMSLVHEKLYQSENLADINFGDYIKSLANSLFQSYGTKGLPSSEAKGKIALKVDCEDVRIPIDSAIPCGLILNELISNSLKHAFPEDKEGEINISLRSPGDEIELVVSDNGVGIPEGLGFRNTESLGLHLVKILAEGQLHGKIELERTAGTSFRIRFDKKGSAYFRK